MEKCYTVIYSNQSNHIYDKLLCTICNETSLRNNFSTHKNSRKHLKALKAKEPEPENLEEPEETEEPEEEQIEEEQEPETITFDDLKPDIQRHIYKTIYKLNDNDYQNIINIINNKKVINSSYLLYILNKLKY